VTGVAAAVLVIGLAAMPVARAADVAGGNAATTAARAGDVVGGGGGTATTAAATATVTTAAPATAPGTTLYVDFHGTCSDSGPGTQADPFCTVQAAANVVDPGQTVEISAATASEDPQSVTISRSGTPGEPITFAWPGTGVNPALSPEKQTGKAVVTLQDVHDVTLSRLNIESWGTDDAVDVVGSSDISLGNLVISHYNPVSATLQSDDIMIDGASSDVTVSRTEFYSSDFEDAVLVKPGAQQVTLTTNLVRTGNQASGFALDGTSGAVVTNNTVLVDCVGSTVNRTGIAFADGSSGTVENNVVESIASSTCPLATVGLSVDASSAASAGGITADYNAFFSEGTATDYSWAGASYPAPAAFTAATGQGAHDLTLPAVFIGTPPEGSPAIDSGDCSAPGLLSTDLDGQPWLRDPLATDASLGNGGCYASRGAFARQDSMPVTFTAPALNSDGYPAGAVPYGAGVTVTSGGTSGWGEPVSYTVDFGDGSSATAATPGTAVSHTYTTAGQYAITVTATDASGMTVNANVAAVYALADSAPPAGLSAAPAGLGSTIGIQPDTAVFTESAGSAGWAIASSAISYGGSGAASNPGSDGTWEYTYAQPGTYTATITVTDKIGRTSTAKATITVGDEPQSVDPFTDYDHSVAGHGLVKIALSKLVGGDCCARGALVDVIVTSPQKAGFVIVYPDGTTRPDLSTVQFQAGQDVENSTLATGGTVDFYNGSAGTVDLQIVTYGIDSIMTTNGYGADGETYAPVTPVTTLPKTEVAGGRTVTFQVAGLHGVPANAMDVALDVTASGGTTGGSFTTYGTTAYGAQAAVNGDYWYKGQQVTRLVMISADGGQEVIQNEGAGSAYFTAEVVGYYLFTGSNSVFLPATPRRLGTVFIPANKSVTMPIAGKDGIPATGTTAVAVDLTASEATASGTLAAYADGTALPFLISASYAPGVSVAGASIVAVGTDGAIRLYNAGSSTVAVNVDLTGSYYAYP
jgi:PKD repeat protein